MDAKAYTSWQLARLADVTDPDAHDGIGFEDTEPVEGSPGARFLRGIAYSTAEALEDGIDEPSDTAAEIADGAVPVYTHEMWSTFVDLAAYTEDVSELGAEDGEMDKQASVALYMIGNRLALALIEAETDDDDDDDE